MRIPQLKGQAESDCQFRKTGRYRRRPATCLGVRLALRSNDVEVGEFLPGLYLLVAGGRRLHAVRDLLYGRPPADVVDLYRRRTGTAHGMPRVRRNRLAVSDFRGNLSLGAPSRR